jgi:GntR family transcriptional regulator/MocR family aminotransferase
VGWLQRGLDAEATARAAAERDIELVPLGRYAFGRAGKNGIVLGFAAVEPKELRRGVEELAVVLRA